jgi:hypothetical protein
MVVLYGQVVSEVDARMIFRVDPARGDADAFGLAGEIRLGRHQCIGPVGDDGKHDVVRITESLAKALANPIKPTQGRR